MAEAFVFNMDSLVTRDYLDARFAEQEARIDIRFAEVKGDFRLVHWMLGIIMACTATPYLQKLFGLLGG